MKNLDLGRRDKKGEDQHPLSLSQAKMGFCHQR